MTKRLIAIAGMLLAFSPVSLAQGSSKNMEAELEKQFKKMKADPRYSKAFDDDGDAPKRFPDARKFGVPLAVPANESQTATLLKNLYTAYKTKMPLAAIAAAENIAKTLNNDAEKLGVAAVSGWYNGAQGPAVLLALQASIQKPSDPLILNNLSAMLNMGGASYHALPLLQSLVKNYPENPDGA